MAGRPKKIVTESVDTTTVAEPVNTNIVKRRIKKEKKSFKTIDPKTKELTIINIGDESPIFRLKNILPSGMFWFESDEGKVIEVTPNSEFEMTSTELEKAFKCNAFVNGEIIFSKLYDNYSTINNCMSDELILNIIKQSYDEFKKMVDVITSEFTFNRIIKIVLSTRQPSEFYQYVELRKSILAQQNLEKHRYMTDAEKNKLGIID